MNRVNKNLHDIEKLFNLDSDEPIGDVEFLSPKWFKDHEEEFKSLDEEAEIIYLEFKAKFGVDALNTLSGENLINTLFLGGNVDNLCHELEYVKRYNQLFASVKGGNVFKYPLFYDRNTLTWMSGTNKNRIGLSVNQAIEKGEIIKSALINSINLLEGTTLINRDNYLELYSQLYNINSEIVDNIWFLKFLHMICPKNIPVFYSSSWQCKVLEKLKIVPMDNSFGRLGQINYFVNECNISNVVFAQIFYKYCMSDENQNDLEEDILNTNNRLTGGENVILYGVPGAGKSWTVKNDYCDANTIMERVVFHPDYSYSDFIGQIMPQTKDGDISYDFIPGPFSKILKKAVYNPFKKLILVIEEINRGNAPAIFGDVFQLLDRDINGASEYSITNSNISNVVFENEESKISIPSNMSIICTMNTSDQNVFTLDTAFQRRWNMRLIENSFKKLSQQEKKFAESCILDSTITWEHFCNTINNQILEKNQNMSSSEDKRLGTHFVNLSDLKFDEKAYNEEINIKEKNIAVLNNRKFPEKVIKYLWDDAFKFYRDEIFKGEFNSLEKVIAEFCTRLGNERFNIFKDNIKEDILDNGEK